MAYSIAGSILKVKRFRHHYLTNCVRRWFLSEAYACTEAWQKRLQSPILQSINMDEFFFDLRKQFDGEKKVNSVDFDIFANNITAPIQLEDLELIVWKFRHTPNAIYTKESTIHAVIRTYLQFGQTDHFVKMLCDRINYGLFPDYYCSNLLMDYFIKQENYRDATRIAIELMLQEDFDHPITKELALYSCHMYLREPKPEPLPLPLVKEESKEEEWIRVRHIRNAFFDDHFDLKDPTMLVGKTLAMVGKMHDNAVGRTYQLIGLGMYQKWSRALKIIEDFVKLDLKPVLYQEGLDTFQAALEAVVIRPDDEEIKVPDPATLNPLDPPLPDYRLLASEKEELKKKFQILSKQLADGGKVSVEMLHQYLIKQVNQNVKQFEAAEIQKQLQLYEEWSLKREKDLENLVEEYLRQERIKSLIKAKTAMEKEEQVLFFFDKRNEWEVKLSEKPQVTEEEDKIDEDDEPIPEVQKPLKSTKK